MSFALSIINLEEAKFACTFGQGCAGECCREGRPPVYDEEVVNLTANLQKFLPLMRPEARAVVNRHGFLVPRRRRLGQRVMRIAQGWCVYFNQGCVLHRVGADEGDKFRYKPSLCSLFPIQQDRQDRWYVRQQGFKKERWKLFCLDPRSSNMSAAESLRDEIDLAHSFDQLQSRPGVFPESQQKHE